MVHCTMAADAHVDWAAPTHVSQSVLAVLDGRCSLHLHNEASKLVNLRLCNKTITFGDKSTTHIKQVGDWAVKVKDEH